MCKQKNIRLGAIVCAFFCFCAPSWKMSCADQSVKKKGLFVVIDQEHILFECQAAQKARSFIESQRLSFQSEIDQQERELREQEETLEKEQPDLSEQEFLVKRQAFENRVSEVHKRVALRRSQLEKVFNKARETILVKMKEIVSRLSKERRISVVLPKGLVLYVEPGLDMTSEVLEELNQLLPEVDVLKEIMPND